MPLPRPGKPSAAQNETVIQTCMQCGAINGADASVCCFCDARLSWKSTGDISARTGLPVISSMEAAQPERFSVNPAEIPPAAEPNRKDPASDWHSEVTSRLQAYRARSRSLRNDVSQPAFAFEETTPQRRELHPQIAAPIREEVRSESPSEPGNEAPSDARRVVREVFHEMAPWPGTSGARSARAVASSRPNLRRPRLNRAEPLEIDISQPALNFEAAERYSVQPSPAYDPSLFTVASLPERRRAGAIDAVLLLFAYGGFLVLFIVLGGHFMLSKLDAAVTLATVDLFYAQYFFLFTFFGGATPGMMARGLRVVSFSGHDPTTRQLLLRSIGYLVSAAPAMLGFLWALWDTDHFTWQDRISQTYLTLEQNQASSVSATRTQSP